MKSKDRIKFGAPCDGGRLAVLERDGEYHTVVARRPGDGHPLSEGAEVVDVEAADESGWQKVHTLYRHGPAQVSTPAYREGYDRIFGKKQAVGQA